MDNNISDIYNFIRTSDSVPTAIRGGVLILSSFIFQGIFYVEKSERYFKLASEVLLFAGVYSAVGGEKPTLRSFGLSLGCAHLLNWLMNAHQIAILRRLGYTRTSAAEFEEWLDIISMRAEANPGIESVYLVGRPARSALKFQSTSDLDIRLVRSNGFMNALYANLCIMHLRIRALRMYFPLDIYLIESESRLEKMHHEESPIQLYPDHE